MTLRRTTSSPTMITGELEVAGSETQGTRGRPCPSFFSLHLCRNAAFMSSASPETWEFHAFMDRDGAEYVARSCIMVEPINGRNKLHGMECHKALDTLAQSGYKLAMSDRFLKAPGLDAFIRGVRDSETKSFLSIMFPLDTSIGERFVPTSFQVPVDTSNLKTVYPGAVQLKDTMALQRFIQLIADVGGGGSVPASSVSLEANEPRQPPASAPVPPPPGPSHSGPSRTVLLLVAGGGIAAVLVVVVLFVLRRRRS